MIIGIPHYNDFEGLRRVINFLIHSIDLDEKNKIIVINSDKPVLCCEKYIEIINVPKEGPLKAYNKLFSIAKERQEDLFLLQTDIYFSSPPDKNWFEEMKNYAKKEDCGMITFDNGGGISGPDFINGFPWIGAWFCYIPYRTIEKIGGYDENIPLGWGVDIDYSYAVCKAGLQIYSIGKPFWICHYPNYTEGHEHEKVENIEQQKKEAFRYMREKWKIGEYKE